MTIFALLITLVMHEQDQRFVTRWERRRAGGRWMYGLKYGAIFGFIMFIVLNLWYLKDKSFEEVYLSSQAINQMGSMVLGGILGYSLIAWNMNQKTYQKIMDRERGNL